MAIIGRKLQAGTKIQVDDTDKLAVSVYGDFFGAGKANLVLEDSRYDGRAGGTSLYSLAQMFMSNGETFDRVRNNHEIVALASAARTAHVNSVDLKNYNSKGMFVTLEITAKTGTPSIRMYVFGKMDGAYEEICDYGSVMSQVGVYSFLMYPAYLTADEDVTKVFEMAVPRLFRIRVEHTNAQSITYKVNCNMLL